MKALLRRILQTFLGLSANERLLVGSAGALLAALLFWLAVASPILTAAGTASRRVAAAEQQLAAVEALRARYDALSGQLQVVENRIRTGPRGNIFTILEELARRSAVQVASMEPRTAPASDHYRETKVQLKLQGVSLAQVVNYLHRIENAPQPFSIKSLRIQTRSDKPSLLDVTFTVSSFEPLGT